MFCSPPLGALSVTDMVHLSQRMAMDRCNPFLRLNTLESSKATTELPSLKPELLNRTLFSRRERRIDCRGVGMKVTLFRYHQHYLLKTSQEGTPTVPLDFSPFIK